jgi:MarR family transcriptional regulator, organic hydroperoxide resistance regulator
MTSSNLGAALTIEQQICYAMHTTVRAFDAAYRDLLGEHGLSYPQYIALMAVGEHGPLTVGALGEVLRLDSGTLSPLLKRLEANGFVRRERSHTDERLVDVTLTPAGRRLERKAQCIPEQLSSSTGMTEREAADLRDAVRQLTDALNASLRKETA